MDMSFIPTHHELIIIERSLRAALEYYNYKYLALCKEIDSLHDEDKIIDAMQRLCWLHDDRLEVKKLLERYDDFRKRDYNNKTYL